MQELISKRLDELQSLEDKAILRDVLSAVFLELYEESERKYTALEQRVRNELPLIYARHSVYSTIAARNRVDIIHPYLSPMIQDEKDEPIFIAKDLTDALESGEQPIIGTVFFEADTLKCRNPDFIDRIYDGVVDAGGQRYPIKCRLSPAKRYIKLVEKLYGLFLQNDMPWTTVNSAYMKKFFDIRLVSVLSPLPPRVKINCGSLDISFNQYEAMVHRDIIPLWNIDKHHIKGSDYPRPVHLHTNHEYCFNTAKLGVENGYLSDYDSKYIQSIRREGSNIIAVSPQKRELRWDMYRFRMKQDSAVEANQYPVISNARRDSFSARLTAAYGVQVKTKAELRGLVASYDEYERIVELKSINFAGEKFTGETYDMNEFIKDELRDPSYRKTLVLGYRAKNREHFLTRDIISFLTSQVQISFPEFNCVGVLV